MSAHGPMPRSAWIYPALGMVLFLVTLALNIVALRVVKKYREAYE